MFKEKVSLYERRGLRKGSKKYVNEGKFPKGIGREISKTEKIRHASDYDDFYIASREETEKTIVTAKKVLQLVGEYLDE